MSETQDPNEGEQLSEMGILDHLEELRWCVARVAIFIAISFPLGVFFAEDIVKYIVGLSNVDSFITTGPTEIFMQRFRIGLMVSLYFSVPYILYQIWKFISPGLYEKEQRMGRYAGLASYILFLIGSMFGLLIIVPICLNFFSGLETDYLRYMPRLTEMISFVLRIAAATGIASQLPVVVVLLFAVGLVTIERLTSVRSYAVVIIFIAAAILTPPDVTSQLMIGLPTYLIYELSIIVCRILNLGKDPKNASRSKVIQTTAFVTLFVIIFGGGYGIWYSKQWYDNRPTPSLVDNPADIEKYRELLATENGPERLSKALAGDYKELEKKSICSVMLDEWKSLRIKDTHRQRLLQYIFTPKVLINGEGQEITMDLKVTRQRNIPLNLSFYWQLKIDERIYVMADDDRNLRYTYDDSKKVDTVIHKDVLPGLPAAAAALLKDGNHKISLILKVASAVDEQGNAAVWADKVISTEVGHVTGKVKKDKTPES